jgi:hypothetical protein
MKKLVEYGYIQKIRKEDNRRAWGKRGAVWRVIYDPRMSLQEVLNTTPKTEEELTREAQDTMAVANRGAKGQLTKQRSKPVDKYDSQQPAGCNSDEGYVRKNNLQVVRKNNPEVVSSNNIELEDKNSINGFVEKRKKSKSHMPTRAQGSHQPERACRAICAAYGVVFQEATGIRWQYDDRQVSIAAAVLNMGYTEDTFIEDATKTAAWFISQDKKPPVSLAWFTRKAENKSGHATPGPDINAILGKVTGAARW